MATLLFKVIVLAPKVASASEFLRRFGFSSIEEWGAKVEGLLAQHKPYEVKHAPDEVDVEVMYNGLTPSGSFCLKIGISSEVEERVLNIFHTPGLVEMLIIMSHHAMELTTFVQETDYDYGLLGYDGKGGFECELPSFYKKYARLPKPKVKELKEYAAMMELWKELKSEDHNEDQDEKKVVKGVMNIPNVHITTQDGTDEWTIMANKHFLSVTCEAKNVAYTIMAKEQLAAGKNEGFKYEEKVAYSSTGCPIDEIILGSKDGIWTRIVANPFYRTSDAEENENYLDFCNEEYFLPAYIEVKNTVNHTMNYGEIPLSVARMVQSVIKGDFSMMKDAKTLYMKV